MSQVKEDGFTHGSAAVMGPQIEKMLAKGELVQLQISGDSLRPTLKPGRDVAVLSPDLSSIKKGDLLYFRSVRSPSGYALHRAIKVLPEGFIMNGDGQNWSEGPISPEKVLAKAIVLVRKGRLINADNFFYRFYVSVWGITRPVRFTLFAIWRKIKRLARVR